MNIQFQKLTEITEPPTGSYWIKQPKLNGVAAVYHKGKLYSRTLKEFPRDRFSDILLLLEDYGGPPLFGELWHPKKTLPQISGLCNHYSEGADNGLYFVYYDVQADGGYMRRCQEHFPMLEYNRCFQLRPVSFNDPLLSRAIESAIDGEVYRHNGGIFLPGPRPTPNVRKLKFWKELEADVIGAEYGNGELSSVIGSLTCRHNNVEFSVGGFDYADRVRYVTCRPKRIKVRFMNLSDKGSPLNPIFMEDLDL